MPESPLILIVDDEENFREIFSMKLTAAGFRVETASDAMAGIAKAIALKPNLILMDMKMPGMEGSEAVMKLREDPTMKDVKIAFLTSLGDPRAEFREADKNFSKEVGAQAYLNKAENLDTTVGRIKEILAE